MTIRYRRRADLRMTELAGEGVVLHLGSRRYFTVSETGVAMLDALAEPRTLDQLVELILARYDVEPDQARRDAGDFVERCVADDLLVVEDGA